MLCCYQMLECCLMCYRRSMLMGVWLPTILHLRVIHMGTTGQRCWNTSANICVSYSQECTDSFVQYCSPILNGNSTTVAIWYVFGSQIEWRLWMYSLETNRMNKKMVYWLKILTHIGILLTSNFSSLLMCECGVVLMFPLVSGLHFPQQMKFLLLSHQ